MEQANFIKKIGTKFVFTCLKCKNPFVSPGYEVRAGRMTKYCSNKCQATSKLRKENALKAMRKLDRSGKNNANYKDGRWMYVNYRDVLCELCGATENKGNKRSLCVHHIDEDRTNSDPKNLVTLCYSCHAKVHHRQ